MWGTSCQLSLVAGSCNFYRESHYKYFMMKSTAFILLCLAFIACVLGQDVRIFQRFSLTDLNPDAICNDGSPGTYFFRRGFGSGANIWTIYLEGGGFCYDKESCEGRYSPSSRHFMTSLRLPYWMIDNTTSPDVNHWGINSANETANPHFYNANQVYVWYCSSDMWSGNTQLFDKWWFRGKVIVQTVVEHLVKVQTPSMTQAKQILLTGFSAGGLGVLNNADFVGEMVAQLVPGATFKAFVDSGWMLDLPYYDQTHISSRAQMALAYKNFNLKLDESCSDIYAQAGTQWRCSIANDVIPFIKTDLFVAGYQYDSPFLSGVTAPFNATTGEFADVFKGTYLMQSDSLPFQFAPNCYCHGVQSYDERWNYIKVNNMSASDSVWAFLSGSGGATTLRNVDTCQEMGCNPTCSCNWPYSV